MNKELPKDWKWVKLGEICGIVYGKGLLTKNLKQEGFPVFGANGVIGFHDKYLYENPMVLISCRGAYSGKINFSPPKSFITNNSLVLSIKQNEELDKNYLFYSLCAAKKNKLITGTAQPQVTINNAVELNIPLPPKPTQLAIVSKIEELFSELEKGIENLFTAKQQLKTYRQSVLKWAFEGKLTNGLNCDLFDLHDEHDLSIAAEPEAEYKSVKNHGNQKNHFNHSSDKGELLKGWKLVSIQEVAKVGTGATPLKSQSEYYGGNISWVTSGAVNDEFVKEATDFVTEKAVRETNLTVYPKHTLLVAMYGEGKTRGKCSELLIEACTNQAIAAISFDGYDISIKPYLKYFLLKNYNDVRKKSSGGVQPNLNLGIIKKLEFPLAPIEEQNLIVQAIESRLSVADKMEESITQSLQQAEALKQSILKKAFEGKLI